MLPLFYNELDVSVIDYMEFSMPKSDIGRDDVELSIDYFGKDGDSSLISFNTWARIGDGRIKGHIYTGSVKKDSDDIKQAIINEMFYDPAFFGYVKDFVDLMAGE